MQLEAICVQIVLGLLKIFSFMHRGILVPKSDSFDGLLNGFNLRYRFKSFLGMGQPLLKSSLCNKALLSGLWASHPNLPHRVVVRIKVEESTMLLSWRKGRIQM